MLSFRKEKASLHKRVVADPAPAFGNRFVGTPVYMATSVGPALDCSGHCRVAVTVVFIPGGNGLRW